MKYHIGICAQLERATMIARSGADFIEPAFGIVAGMEESAFRTGSSILKDSGLQAESMNSMLPGTAILYGNETQTEELLNFVHRGMERAATLGCHNVVFGSGTARQIPQGWAKNDAQIRLAALLDKFCSIAQPYGIRIAIEPLRASETNFIHLLTDAAEIAALLPECKNLGVNADIYHMLEGNESFSALHTIKNQLFHTHICAPDRHFPRNERPQSDMTLYRSFFRALEDANYQGSVSIEAIAKNLEEECAPALQIIRAARDT